MKLVIDASFAMSWFFADEQNKAAEEILVKLKEFEVEAFVPDLWVIEVLNSLLQGEKRKRITAAETEMYIEVLQNYPISIVETTLAAQTKIAAYARKYNLSAYDATYLNLAVERKLPLATLDSVLGKAAEGEGVRVVG